MVSMEHEVDVVCVSIPITDMDTTFQPIMSPLTLGVVQSKMFAFQEQQSVEQVSTETSFQEKPTFGLFAEPEFDERRRYRRSRRGAHRSHDGRCFTNPRTGVRMKAMGGRRGFKRC